MKLELQRYEADACYEDFLEHAEHNKLEIAYLARILQETCQKNALSCKILQDILQDSCKICIFFQLGIDRNTMTKNEEELLISRTNWKPL